ncbi:MAG: AroM family protein [Vicinamibacterales bacterium]
MTAPALGTVTIGQAPRPDVVPVLEAHLPPGVSALHVGVLDRLGPDEIAAGFAPRPNQPRMVTRMADGRPVELDAAAAEAGVQRKLHELEDAGCSVVVVLCTGVFRGLRTRRAWLIEPDRILPALVGGLVGSRKVGIVSPLGMPLDAARRKWAALQVPPRVAVALPYAPGEDAVAAAALELKRAGADLLLMDCIGYADRHRRAAAQAADLPVLLSNELIARVTGACFLGEAS